MTPAIVGIGGPSLAPEEAALLRAHAPAGVILFARNIVDPPQLAVLTANLRSVLPPDALLMVDQEGGRVARLRPPHWRAHPPASAIGAVFAAAPSAGLRAAWLSGALIGAEVAQAGFNLVAAPVLDLAWPGAHDVIGDRAFAAQPAVVGRLGRAFAAGLLAAGVQPIVKHAPGHGRARADSHRELPRVEANDLAPDILPFALNADLPWAMTAHILYTGLDAALPATLSPGIIGSVIRATGFFGVLVTDDLAMHALTGSPGARAAAALAAGCDIALHCSGELAATGEVLRACPRMAEVTRARLAAGQALAARRRIALDVPALAAERDRLLAA